MHSTGDNNSTSSFRKASYTTIPSSSSATRSSHMEAHMSSAATLLEQQMKWMLWKEALTFLGNPPSIIHHTSNLFHFLVLLPLVSSVYKMSGAITTCLPSALLFRLTCSLIRSYHIYCHLCKKNNNKTFLIHYKQQNKLYAHHQK